jgi:uncharacterized protein (DUF2141 family)
MIKRMIICLIIFLFFSGTIFGHDVSITIEIHGVLIQNGRIAVAIFSNENEFKKRIPFASFWMESINTDITYNIDLPEGEYVVTVYQDINNNGKLDNFLFRPREPVGITNYNGGIPGSFQKLKTPVNNDNRKISINIGRI